MKKWLTAKLTIYKNDLKTKGLYWSVIHRLYKIPYAESFLKPLVTFFKPTYIWIQNQKLFIDKSDEVVSQALLMYNTWEPFETDVFLKHINKNDIVVDVGAHIGYYTLLAAIKVGNKGKVFSFEPDHKNFHLLQKNVAENNYTNVSLHNIAISDSKQKRMLYIDKKNTGDHRLYATKEHDKKVSVETITFDDFFANNTANISLIKLDIQGYEHHALLGAKKILQNSKKLILLTEFYPKGLFLSGSSAKAYLHLLSSYGFTFFEVSEKEQRLKKVTVAHLLEKYSASSEDFTNMLCVRN